MAIEDAIRWAVNDAIRWSVNNCWMPKQKEGAIYNMSYDIQLKNPDTGEVVILPENHTLAGGTYALGGTRKAWLNVTYNYGSFFRNIFDKVKGIRVLYGMSAKNSIPVLENAIKTLTGAPDSNYWAPTEGNARAALCNLLDLAKMVPPGSVWDGD